MRRKKFSGKEFFSTGITPQEYINQAINGFCMSANRLSYMLQYVEVPSTELFVELGCGPGESLAHFISANGSFQKYIVVDASKDMASYTESKYQSLGYNVSSMVADLESDPLSIESGTADIVICTSTVAYISSLDTLFGEAHRILKSGGYFGFDMMVISTPRVRKGFSYPTRHDVVCFCHTMKESIYKLEKSFKMEDFSILIEDCISRKQKVADYVSYVFQKK